MVSTPARLFAAIAVFAAALPASAQPVPAAPPPSSAPAGVADAGTAADLAFVPSEPDFTLIALPSTLRLPDGKWAFRVTHRFTRALAEGSFGDLASDLFGFDGSALVGLELRYGLRPGTQLALLRTSDRTIQLLAQQSILGQGRHALAVDALAAVQGLDNLSESFTGTLGVLVSRRFGDRGAAYVQPMLVFNPLPEQPADDENTSLMVGVGARLRFGASTYVVVELAPRLSGASPGDHHAAVALEKRRGGHAFQVNVSNSFATTLGQVARAYGGTGEWHIGFNISRKFFRPAPRD